MSPDTGIGVAESGQSAPREAEPTYLSGFGNEFASEAVPGALPRGQNAPQVPPLGLYTEQLSGTPFTAPRAENRRSWLYRIRPSAMHRPFRRIDDGLIRTAPCSEAEPSPNRLRWDPLPFPERPADFVEGLTTIGTNGDAGARHGIGVHVYRANSLDDRPDFLRCRRRAADRAAERQPASAYRVRRDRRGARRDRGHPARRQIPRRAAGRTRRRICLRELRRAVPAARTRADRRQWPRQPARLSDAVRRVRRRARRPASSSSSSRVISGRPSWTIRRSTSSPGTAITRRTNTISRGSTRSARSASIIRTRRSSRC